MPNELQITGFRGVKPSPELPVIFSGWGGKYSTVAIFKVCPEYIGIRKVVLLFDENYLVEANKDVQSTVGSGFTVDAVLSGAIGEAGGKIIMHVDPAKVKDTIMIGRENKSTRMIGSEYSIAFYCGGEFELTIAAIDEENNCEELYKRSFCCK